MAILTVQNSLAGDLLRVALQAHDGRLKFPGVLAPTLRGAVLVDLAAAGRLQRAADGTQIDTTPTGWDAADELLTGVNDHPDRTLEWWLRRGTPHLHELIAELLADGVWSIARHGLGSTTTRYVDAEEARIQNLCDHVENVAAGTATPEDEREAALSCLAVSSGSTAPVGDDRLNDLLNSCGPISWIVRDVIAYLQAAQADDRAGLQANLMTGGFQLGSV